MSEIAAVVLAHADPDHFARLAGALDGLPVFLHCDTKASDEVVGRMRAHRDVYLLPRRDTRLGGWSLVAAELSGVEAALQRTSAGHIAVMSGADYPLLSTAEIVAEVGSWGDRSFIYNRPIPYAQWNNDRHPDGGLWRTRYRFLHWRDNPVALAGRPLRCPFPRRGPADLTLRASSHWKIYSRADAYLLLRVLEARPDLVSFGRSSFIPEESFVASVLASEAIVGASALRVCYGNPWFYRFSGQDHPRWLELRDFPEMADGQRAHLFDFAVPDDEPRALPQHRKLFARKFSSRMSSELVDKVDHELRR